MSKTMTFFLTSFLSLSVLASEGPCVGFAKFGAIRAYKSEMGTVQGSDGIGYSAVLKNNNKDIYTYLVTISDNNEDGEYWEVDYDVKVQTKSFGCKLLTVKKGEIR